MGREEHPATGCGHAMELSHDRGGIVDVLQHLDAESDIGDRVVERERLGEPVISA